VARVRLSIRHELLLLGALATASIWAGALLQYLQLRAQTQQLQLVTQDLKAADRYSALAHWTAQERGLSNGWLSQAAIRNPAELAEVRLQVDRFVAPLPGSEVAGDAPRDVVPPAVTARLGQLVRLRGQIDRREIPSYEAFAFYTDLVGAVQDTSARRLADGMVAVGLAYEYINHLQYAAEDLAQLRGLVYGALRAGELPPQVQTALSHAVVLYENEWRGYERSVPDAVRPELAAAFASPAVQASIDCGRRLLLLHRLDAVGLDATSWWSLATEAVDTLTQTASNGAAALTRRADQRIEVSQRHQDVTVLALIVLGVVTLGLVLSTLARILKGIARLLQGLDRVGARGNFDSQIDASGSDEFGTIATGINKLITIADSTVNVQQQLSMTDPLTGAMNRRGFEQQLVARTLPARGHIEPMCLIMIDIDDFKLVNDTLGHLSGDQALSGLVKVMKDNLRPDDVLARFGGEEFVVLLPGCRLHDGLVVAEKLRGATEAHDFGIRRNITISLGVAEYNRINSPDEFIAAADLHLYAAKAAGRNAVRPVAPVAHEVGLTY
jgi:diguanylate cyclase (GGDEF)-like protein